VAVRKIVLLALALVAVALLPPAAGAAHAPGGDLLPDLVPRHPVALSVQVTASGRRYLRFGSSVRNAHTGPLELRPRAEDCNRNGDRADDRTAYQRIYRDEDGNGIFSRAWERRVWSRWAGCMVFHRSHGHWHFESFTEYSLQAYDVDGSLGPVVATSGKVSFCIVDSSRTAPVLRGSPRTRFYGGSRSCTPRGTWGISVGWADYYGPRVSGQALEVTALPAGFYCLVVAADPENRLVEVSGANNVRRIGIWLERRTVEWFPYGPC
jgi:hypothetical protein